LQADNSDPTLEPIYEIGEYSLDEDLCEPNIALVVVVEFLDFVGARVRTHGGGQMAEQKLLIEVEHLLALGRFLYALSVDQRVSLGEVGLAHVRLVTQDGLVNLVRDDVELACDCLLGALNIQILHQIVYN
jgi:hypothetical protein